MYIGISMKHKQDILMKFDIPELFVVYFYPSLSVSSKVITRNVP